MDFNFVEVKDDGLKERLFAFRYKVFLEIYPEYLKNIGFTDNMEFDKYDPYSTHFVALNDYDEICASVRLIFNSPIGYPTENSMVFNRERFERDKLAEMSRIFVDAKYRNIKTTKVIIQEVKKFMYIKMMTLGIEYSYGSLEESFLRLLRIYKMNYHVIGEKQIHDQFGTRYPCILYTKELGTDNPELIKLWEERHQI